jgi:hypothetical protein
MRKKMVSKITEEIRVLDSLKWLSIIEPVKAVIATVVTIIKKALGNCFLMSITAPCLLKNFLSEKLTPLNFLISSGAPINVNQNIRAAEYGKGLWDGFSPIIHNIIAKPEVTPSQKIRFQRLSLLRRCWIKPCSKGFGTDVVVIGLAGGVLRLLQKFVKSSVAILVSYVRNCHIYTNIVSNIDRISKQIIPSILVISLVCCVNNANASTPQQLQEIFADAEVKYDIPRGLLVSIARVESAINPYALNVNGKAVNARTNDEARDLIQGALRVGITNIDIGIMQLNYRWHQGEFKSVDQMLSPEQNIAYAARFLSKLKQRHGDWHTAIRHYHSANPEHYHKYSRKVVMYWLGN